MIKDGEISETGTYEQLITDEGAFAELIQCYLMESEELEESDHECKFDKSVYKACKTNKYFTKTGLLPYPSNFVNARREHLGQIVYVHCIYLP